MSRFQLTVLCAVVSWGLASVGAARDQIAVVGSSTVYPFSTLVADHFAKSGQFKTPTVGSSSTSDGFPIVLQRRRRGIPRHHVRI